MVNYLLWDDLERHPNVLWAFHWSTEVEIGDIHGHVVAPGIDNVGFHNNFIVGTSTVGVPVSSRHLSLSPSIVNLVLCFSSLSGL